MYGVNVERLQDANLSRNCLVPNIPFCGCGITGARSWVSRKLLPIVCNAIGN